MKNREQRVAIATDTVAIIAAGHYITPAGRVVDIASQIEAARTGTVLHDLSTLVTLPRETGTRPADLEVTPETTFAALQRLTQEGATDLGCLNFASAKNPGGGFLTGAQAQEEALARSSGLYDCLLTQPGYYEINRSHRSCLYQDLAIVSPCVPFIRDDEGILLEEPVIATVITSPAPNAGAVASNETDAVPKIIPTLQRRAEMVLRMAVLHGVKNLVLGAWGCGVFRNDPVAVAGAFHQLLQPEGVYHRRFQRVVCAVYTTPREQANFDAFHAAFAKQL
jgi:uncharacterized protein (TIGR02452 family)